MEHAATLDLEDFEDPDLQDKLDRARRQTMGRMNLMSQLFGQAQDAVTVAGFAAGLLVYAPWLLVLLAIALVPAFVGEAHFKQLDPKSVVEGQGGSVRVCLGGRRIIKKT